MKIFLNKRSKARLIKLINTTLLDEAVKLLDGARVEVWYISSCDIIDDETMKDFIKFMKCLKALASQGIEIKKTPVDYKNGSATVTGDLWHGFFFEIVSDDN
jgi:hypothetical protein